MLDKKNKKRGIHRAKIIKGQIEGLLKAIEEGLYCPSLLEQSLSIQNSLKSLDAYILENHLKTCVKDKMINKDKSEKVIKELIKIYNLSNK